MLTGRNITGDYTASFELDSNPSTAIYGSNFTFSVPINYFRVRATEGVFDGSIVTNADVVFYTVASLGGVRIAIGSDVFSVLGTQLFSGSVASPTFNLGTYAFTEQAVAGDTHSHPVDATLVISDASTTSLVPEPATLAMLIAGLSLMGATLRRRASKLTAA